MADQGGDNFVIHTMQDDLAGKVPNRPAAAAPPIAPPKKSAPAVPAPRSPVAAAPAALRGKFPLPPAVRGNQPPTKFIPRRRRRRTVFLALIFVVVLAAAGLAAYAYFFPFSAPSAEVPTPSAPAAQLQDIIPGSAAVVAHYRVSSPDTRSQLLELWQGNSRPLLQGNPTNLLTEANLAEFAYVMLEDNTRPFLIVPKDSLPADIAASLTTTQLAEVSGWQVVHGVNALDYVKALAANPAPTSEAGASPPPELIGNQLLDLRLGTSALNQLRSHIASPSFGAGLLTSINLTLSVGVTNQALLVGGLTAIPSPLPTASVTSPRANAALLELIPADATFVRLGASLRQDIADWQTIATILDSDTLAVPAVAALVDNFDVPYAYYHRAGLDGVSDVGLIVEIPKTITPALTAGDSGLEQALTAMIPLISSGRPAVTLRFADGVYQGTPLRFVNLAGSIEALDYAIAADRLLISTSKEGMLALLDTAAARASNFPSASPWQNLLTQWQTIPETEHIFFGFADYHPMLELLPTADATIPFGLAFSQTAIGHTVNGAVIIQEPSASSPSPTP